MIVKIFMGVAHASLAACGGGGDSAPSTFEVKYAATGFGGGDVTYATPGGGTAQEHVANGVAFTAKAGDFIYVSVQNNSSDASAVSLATIDVSGKPFRAERSMGPFFIATASATCC